MSRFSSAAALSPSRSLSGGKKSLARFARQRSALILPVVLVIIGLLALMLTGYVFFMRAETAGTEAFNDGHQARVTAESGLEEIIAVLRKERDNPTVWYDAPQRWRHVLAYSPYFDRTQDPVKQAGGTRKDYLNGEKKPVPAWRYSVVAANLDGPTDTIRYGITPEAGKLNLNKATDQQIEQLLMPLLVDLGLENPQDYVSALLDWRDKDSDTREGGAENDYYNTLQPPYSAKNGDFDSVEELLLVKGFTAAILYGEDVNRNGILDGNEDDGDKSFPYYDNGNGILNHGIAPFLTVWSRERDAASDNTPRVNLNGDAGKLREKIDKYFQQGELSDATINFLTTIKQQNIRLNSPADLYQVDVREQGDADQGPPGSQPSSQPTSQPGATDPRLRNSPVTMEEMPYIMDRFTIRQAQPGQWITGLINVNTAPARVLNLIPGITPEAVTGILANRRKLDAASLRSTAWLLTSGAVPPDVFRRIAPSVTTHAYQFQVEVVGYADHAKIARRYEWVVEMVGVALGQVRYQRDLTSLGVAWPIDVDTTTVATP